MIMNTSTNIMKVILGQRISSVEDHKVIAKQFLITGIFWALLGGTLFGNLPSATWFSRHQPGMA